MLIDKGPDHAIIRYSDSTSAGSLKYRVGAAWVYHHESSGVRKPNSDTRLKCVSARSKIDFDLICPAALPTLNVIGLHSE